MKMLIIMVTLSMASSLEAAYVRVPKMVILDLENSLWPSLRIGLSEPPFKNRGKTVIDSDGDKFNCNPDAKQILNYLNSSNIPISVIADTNDPKTVLNLITLFKWDDYFQKKLIFPGNQKEKVKRISTECGIDLKDMLYFGDHNGVFNVKKCGKIKTCAVETDIELTMKVVSKALKKFSDLRAVHL